MTEPVRLIARWPEMMLRKDAASYCSLSLARFDAEVDAGRLPAAHRFGGKDHWRKSQIDAALDRLTGDAAVAGDEAPYRRQLMERVNARKTA